MSDDRPGARFKEGALVVLVNPHYVGNHGIYGRVWREGPFCITVKWEKRVPDNQMVHWPVEWFELADKETEARFIAMQALGIEQ